MKPPPINTFRIKLPDRDGWWWWLENQNRKPVRLLIVATRGGGEVATDGQAAAALGIDEDDVEAIAPDQFYWEMTGCKTMAGQWAFSEAVNVIAG